MEAQQQVAHDQGSSHGGSRIIRMVYQEHPSYVSWLKRSYDQWRQLEKEEDEQLLVTTGCLNASTESAMGAHGHSCYQGAVESAELHDLPHSKLSALEANSKFPAFSFPENFKALHDPAGGFLYPEKAIKAFVNTAKKHGADVVCNAPVSSWKSIPKEGAQGEKEEFLVEVCDGDQKFKTQRLILTAGAWMSHLVPELAPVLSIERQVVGWFGPPAPAAEEENRKVSLEKKDLTTLTSAFTPEKCPVFLIDDDEGYFYGFPADTNYDNLVKIGKYNHLNQCVSVVDSLDRTVHPEDEDALRTCLRKYMPRLGTAPMQKSSVCMFTNTPDGHFILDYHPKYRPQAFQNEKIKTAKETARGKKLINGPVVVLGSACSGHGFKFAPVLGEILADLAMNTINTSKTGLEGLEMHTLEKSGRGEEFKEVLKLFKI